MKIISDIFINSHKQSFNDEGDSSINTINWVKWIDTITFKFNFSNEIYLYTCINANKWLIFINEIFKKINNTFTNTKIQII